MGGGRAAASKDGAAPEPRLDKVEPVVRSPRRKQSWANRPPEGLLCTSVRTTCVLL